jgi:hypothetical protein
MYTIKVMSDNGYDAFPCHSYRVEKTEDAVYIHTFDFDSPASQGVSIIKTVAYVENALGKTVDRVYGLTKLEEPKGDCQRK